MIETSSANILHQVRPLPTAPEGKFEIAPLVTGGELADLRRQHAELKRLADIVAGLPTLEKIRASIKATRTAKDKAHTPQTLDEYTRATALDPNDHHAMLRQKELKQAANLNVWGFFEREALPLLLVLLERRLLAYGEALGEARALDMAVLSHVCAVKDWARYYGASFVFKVGLAEEVERAKLGISREMAALRGEKDPVLIERVNSLTGRGKRHFVEAPMSFENDFERRKVRELPPFARALGVLRIDL